MSYLRVGALAPRNFLCLLSPAKLSRPYPRDRFRDGLTLSPAKLSMHPRPSKTLTHSDLHLRRVSPAARPRSDAAERHLIEKEPEAAKWRALHTGCERSQATWASLLGDGDGEPAAGLMSLADWVCALAPCFDPEREGAGGVPPALSRFLQKRKAAALPPAGQSQTFAEAASPPSGDFARAIHSLTATLGKSKALAPQKAGPPPPWGR